MSTNLGSMDTCSCFYENLFHNQVLNCRLLHWQTVPILGKPAFQLVLDPAPAARSADRDIGRNRGNAPGKTTLSGEKKRDSYLCGSVSGWVDE